MEDNKFDESPYFSEIGEDNDEIKDLNSKRIFKKKDDDLQEEWF
jgi:hypothetical protein